MGRQTGSNQGLITHLSEQDVAGYHWQLEKGFDLAYRVAGRVNIIGEHIDYNDGFVLPAAINRYFYFFFNRSSQSSFRISAVNLQEDFHFGRLNGRQVQGWKGYVTGVLHALKEADLECPGFNCSFGGNIPSGAGLSSSAALCSGLIYGLNELFDLQLTRKKMALLAQRAEHINGTKCGIMDPYAILMGKKDHAVLIDCIRNEHLYIPVKTGDHIWLLVNSNLEHALSGGAYNELRLECESIWKLIRLHCPDYKSFRDVAVDRVRQEKILTDRQEKILVYILGEIQRVREVLVHIDENNLESLGRCLYQSHEGLSSHLGVSTPEMDFLVQKAMTMDQVIGARMTGGGFGGCTLNLVKRDGLQEFMMRLETAYRERFGTGPSFYPISFEDGIIQLSEK